METCIEFCCTFWMIAFYGELVSTNLPVSIFKVNGYNLWPLCNIPHFLLARSCYGLALATGPSCPERRPTSPPQHLKEWREKIWTDLSKSAIFIFTVRKPAVIKIIYERTFYYQSACWNCYCKSLKRKFITYA